MYLKKIMAATFAATALAGQAQEKTFSIIPEPVEITVIGQGESLIQRNTVIRMSEPTLAPSAAYLADYMDAISVYPCKWSSQNLVNPERNFRLL